VNRSGSPRRGRRSLFKKDAMCFLRSTEKLAWAFPSKRSACVAASAVNSGISRPACFSSSMLANGLESAQGPVRIFPLFRDL
jgi:hypothetical protein